MSSENQHIKKAILLLGGSIKEAAAIIGMSRDALSNLLHNKTKIRKSNAEKIETATGGKVKVSELMGLKQRQETTVEQNLIRQATEARKERRKNIRVNYRINSAIQSL